MLFRDPFRFGLATCKKHVLYPYPYPLRSLKSISLISRLDLPRNTLNTLSHSLQTSYKGSDAIGDRVTADDYGGYLGLLELPAPVIATP
jgi:hypothetical protein